MKTFLQVLVILFCTAAFVPAALAKKHDRPPLPAKVMQANSVYVDCVCPRGLAVAREEALQQLQGWGRFQISKSKHETDLVMLFSGNPYLGDYTTRDGPDTRFVSIEFTILTVIDPNTGATLWSDGRRWGSWRVRSATKDLIKEFRDQMEGQTQRWTLNDILMCSVTPVYAGFAHLTPEQALANNESGTGRASGSPDHLTLTSSDAPRFCQNAQFLFGPDHRIIGYEVSATRADDLDIGEVLQQADRFDFSGGKYTDGGKVYFNVLSKDRRIRILFGVDGPKTVLSRVSFFY